MGKSSNNRTKKKYTGSYTPSQASKEYSLEKRGILSKFKESEALQDYYGESDDYNSGYNGTNLDEDDWRKYASVEAEDITTKKKDTNKNKQKKVEVSKSVENSTDKVSLINESIRQQALYIKKLKGVKSGDSYIPKKMEISLQNKLDSYIRDNVKRGNIIKQPSKEELISKCADNIQYKRNKIGKVFQNVEDICINTVKEPTYGVEQCWNTIIKDFCSTGFSWLFNWVTLRDKEKISTLTESLVLGDDYIGYEDLTLKCLMDIIRYLSSLIFEESPDAIQTVLGKNRLVFCKINTNTDKSLYQVLMTDSFGSTLDRCLRNALNVVIRLNYMYFTKKYIHDVQKIFNEVRDLKVAKEQNLRTIDPERLMQIESMGVLTENSIALRNLPQDFYNQFLKNKTLYQEVHNEFTNFIIKSDKNLRSALNECRIHIKKGNIYEMFYEGEIECIYKLIYNNIICKSEEFMKQLEKDISSKLNNRNINISILPNSNENKVVYLKTALDLVCR